MANCLITKLKANVIDDALYKVNTMTLRVKESGIYAYRMISLSLYNQTKVTLKKGNIYSNQEGTTIAYAEGSEISNGFTNKYVGVDEETILEIENYHEIAQINCQSNSATINGNAINVEDFGFSKDIGSIQLRFVTSAYGSIERFVERISLTSRSTGIGIGNEVVIDTRNNAIKFNDVTLGALAYIVLNEETIEVYKDSSVTGTIIGTYNKASKTWTYAS